MDSSQNDPALTPSVSKSQNQSKSNVFVCPTCQKQTKHYTLGFCFKCYRNHVSKSKPSKICKECGEKKQIYCKGFCRTCYFKNANKLRKCQGCEKEKKIFCRGFCQQCYYLKVVKQQKKQTEICKQCGEEKFINSKGFCSSKCYLKHSRKINVCQKCNEEKPIFRNEICQQCYYFKSVKKQKKKIKGCKECGKDKPIVSREFCRHCYIKSGKKFGVCQECNEEKPIINRGICQKCYYLKVTKPRYLQSKKVGIAKEPETKKSCIAKELEALGKPSTSHETEILQEFLCSKCHREDKIYYAKDMCQLCYFLNYRYNENETSVKSTKPKERQWSVEDFLLNLDDQEILCEDDILKNNTPSQMKSTTKELSPVIITLDEDENLPSTSQQNGPARNNSINQQQRRPQIAVPTQIDYVDLSSGEEDEDSEY